jgi:hypothetical protein
MADEGSTTRQAATDEESGVHRLRDIVVEEVSLVDRAANKRRFLLVKRSSQMADDGKPKGGGTLQEGRSGAKSGAGGRKPRPKPDEDVDKARPRVMRAASDDEEDDEDTEKARRSTKPDDEEDGEDETEKANDEDDEDEDEDEDEEEEESKPGKQSSGKPFARGEGDASGKQRPGGGAERTRKVGDDALVLAASVKNAVLRALAQALERLMAIANQVKEADEPNDENEAGAPDALIDELKAICETLEGIGEHLAEPAEKSRDKKPDAARGRSAKAEVSKAGRRMAKDRLERFQKALELLAAVLKELTAERQSPTPSDGSAAKPLGKRESQDLGGVVASVDELTRVVKRQEEQLVRLQKTRATSNAIPVEGGIRREIQEVSWPLDMNRPITRDHIDKAVSFYDE